MKTRMSSILACPACRGPLDLVPFDLEEPGGDEVREGILRCACGHGYPIVRGIPRMDPMALEEHPDFIARHRGALGCGDFAPRVKRRFLRDHGATKRSFGFEWTRYDYEQVDPKYFRNFFLRTTGLDAEALSGKLALDVGCGMGRYSRVAAELGAEVVSIDLGDGIERVRETVGGGGTVHPVQGNLMARPFRDGTFDVIFSIGVLHHTPDTRRAFESLLPALAEGGTIYIEVYGPMRRAWLNRVLRSLTCRLPRRVLWHGVKVLTPIPEIPILRTVALPIPMSRKANRWDRFNDNFDWYSPRFQHHHTVDEVAGWFRDAGLEDVAPHEGGLVCVSGRKPCGVPVGAR
ncbi:MAG: methyltransferase domain-containing protein [Planctomycetes bacterium]|nr:methyltransferase domain-containing protein [Planctomycetota bacterium]